MFNSLQAVAYPRTLGKSKLLKIASLLIFSSSCFVICADKIMNKGTLYCWQLLPIFADPCFYGVPKRASRTEWVFDGRLANIVLLTCLFGEGGWGKGLPKRDEGLFQIVTMATILLTKTHAWFQSKLLISSFSFPPLFLVGGGGCSQTYHCIYCWQRPCM